jgi:hypothetical protein
MTRHQKHWKQGGKGLLTPGFFALRNLLTIVHYCAVSSTVILFYFLSLIFTTIFLAVSLPLFLFGEKPLLRFYAAWNGSFVPTFRDNLSVPSSRVKQSGPIVWLETSIRNCHFTCVNTPPQKKRAISFTWRRNSEITLNPMKFRRNVLTFQGSSWFLFARQTRGNGCK